MRPPVDHIAAPPLPADLPWVNVAMLRMDQQLGRPVLIEFWDFCRPNSMRTLPYLMAWHERYEAAGLRVIGVHSPGFETSRDPDAVRAAVQRLGITYPVAVDSELAVWRLYDNLGWPARYLFDHQGHLFDYHYGEGGYADTESAIQELLGLERPLLEPLRPEDAPGALLVPQSEEAAGAYSGPYEAGEVWAVLDGHGWVSARSSEAAAPAPGPTADRQPVEHPGAYRLIRHERSTSGVLELELGGGVECLAVCFIPGLAP